MSRRVTVAISVLLAFVPLLILDPRPALAQTSIGFTSPGDLSALLAYRLPNWGFNSSIVGLQLSGDDQNDGRSESTRAAGHESLYSRWYRESEQRTWNISLTHSGDWKWNGQTLTNGTRPRQSTLRGDLGLAARVRKYLTGMTYAVASGEVQGTYYEERGAPRFVRVDRTFSATAQLGAGIGRQRDVTPLIEAERMNERLRALGRTPLALEQAERIAEVLARIGGYRQVFDRPDRRLWRDAIEPVIGMGAPLTPYEVLYLRDATFEQLGTRIEGSLAEAGVQLTQRGSKNTEPRSTGGPWLAAGWSRNLSLDHQVSANLNGNYLWSTRVRNNANESDQDLGSVLLSLEHLWVVADRINWDNTVTGSLEYLKLRFSWQNVRLVTHDRTQRIIFNSRLSYFVEDRLSLSPEFRFSWNRASHTTEWGTARTDYRTYEAHLGLNYRLAGALL